MVAAIAIPYSLYQVPIRRIVILRLIAGNQQEMKRVLTIVLLKLGLKLPVRSVQIQAICPKHLPEGD